MVTQMSTKSSPHSSVFSLAIERRSLMAFRLGLGIVIAVDILMRLLDVREHYTDDGIWPRNAAMVDFGKYPWLWSLHYLNGSLLFNTGLLIVTALSGLWLASGRSNRWATLITWVLVSSVQHRTPGLNMGADTLLLVLLFWNFFLPSSTLTSDKQFSAPTTGWPQRALLLQVCLMYWSTALFKSHPVWRSDYSAVEFALGIESFQAYLGPEALRFPSLLKVLTCSTIVLEELGPIVALLGSRFWIARTAAAISFMAFHLLGLGLTMRLGIFPWVCAVAWLPFLPAQFWDRVAHHFGRLARHPQVDTCSQQLPLRQWYRLPNPLVISCLLYVSWWNLSVLYTKPLAKIFPEMLRTPGHWLGIAQNWQFFAPRPATRDGWYVAKAKTSDGREFDPLHGGGPVTWNKPVQGVAKEFKNSRWHKYLHSTFLGRRQSQVDEYARYITREWNQSHTSKIESLELYYMLQDHFHPEDGIRPIKVYPSSGLNSEGKALFQGDIRWEAEQADQKQPVKK